jgi:amidohydrolase
VTVDVSGFLAGHTDELVAVRRHLHSHPELGNQERETTALLARRLTAAGLEPRLLSTGTGLTCDIGTGDGPVIALRADLDALPLPDDKPVSYRSTVPGVCHACGHDVHTTMVLGAGLALQRHAAELPGRVRLVFQPAEELTPGGALQMIAEGGLDGVSAIFALHCDPRLETGKVGVRSGPITAAADQVEIRLTGPGGHTARPHLTADLVYVAARVITDVPAGLSRLVDPRSGLALVFGAVQAGVAANAIPECAVIRGTLRVLQREAWEQAPELVERLLEATAGPLGAKWELNYQRGVPPVVNEPFATALLSQAGVKALGVDQVVATDQSLGGEDFAWYLDHVPGSMARLGTMRDGPKVDLHAGSFDVDERAIGIGVRILVQAALDGLDHYAVRPNAVGPVA